MLAESSFFVNGASDGLADDIGWMRMALEEARRAAAAGDVPVGAVIVRKGELLATGRNRREVDGDPTAHAEIVALREAARQLGRWYLDDTTIYVTLEPCPMCAGAIVAARVARLVFGSADPKGGAAGTLYNIVQDPRLNHRVQVTSGVLAEESAELLRAFFRQRRGN